MPLRRGGRRAFPANVCQHHQHDQKVTRTSSRGLTVAWSALLLLLAPDVLSVATSAPLARAATTQVPKGFQGIPWGAPADAIEGKFGETAERDEESCNDDLSRQTLAAAGHDCFVMRMEPFVLEGVPFSASFRFDPLSKGLDAVVLTSSLKSKNLTPRAVKKLQSECRQNYDRISRQFSAEFPSSLLPHQLFEKPVPPFAQANYRAWEGGDTSVRLRWSFRYTDHWKRWRRAEGCEIEVRYAAMSPDEEEVPE